MSSDITSSNTATTPCKGYKLFFPYPGEGGGVLGPEPSQYGKKGSLYPENPGHH